jgi:hypothetical protein
MDDEGGTEGGTDDTTTVGGEQRIGGYRMMATGNNGETLYNANDEKERGNRGRIQLLGRRDQ